MTKAVASDGADDSLDIYWYVNDGNIYDVETTDDGAGRCRDRGPSPGDRCPAGRPVDGGTVRRPRRPRRADPGRKRRTPGPPKRHGSQRGRSDRRVGAVLPAPLPFGIPPSGQRAAGRSSVSGGPFAMTTP